MSTKHAEIFAALAKPFPEKDVKTRPQGGRQLAYITARTAMNRLDAILGPENWWDRYTPLENSVVCELTIRLPDGQVVTKCDAGGYAGMSDQGDDDKSGFSDAFKRACVKFGIARYLYRDGVPDFSPGETEPDPGPRPSPRAGAPPARKFSDVFAAMRKKAEQDWHNEMKIEGIPPDHQAEWRSIDTTIDRAVNELISRAIEYGKATLEGVAKDGKPDRRDPAKCRAMADRLASKLPKFTDRVIEVYLAGKVAEMRRALDLPDSAAEHAALDERQAAQAAG